MKKWVVVCGSTQGIGFESARQLAEDGFQILLIARSEDKLKQAADALPGSGHNYLVANFSRPDQLKAAISSWVETGNKAYGLVNNSGGPKAGPAIDAPVEEFLSAFNQHLICNHILVQALVPGMKENGGGRIVNIISTSVKQPLPNLGVSNTIRGAVGNWSKTLANELGQFNITVNNVLPGATRTGRLEQIAAVKAEKTGEKIDDLILEMGEESPMKRVAEPSEVAAAVRFLMSPGASYINGINIPVDGGRTKNL